MVHWIAGKASLALVCTAVNIQYYQGVSVAEFSGRLSDAPLVYALCQVRFAPVLKMASHVPDIQERLRGTYEGFAEEHVPSIQVMNPGEPATVRSEPRWRFERSDHSAGYVLHNASFVYHTTLYTDFEEFISQVVYGLQAIAMIANIPRLQRIGLRYVDLIEGRDDVPVEDFLNPRLRGIGTELHGVTENISQYTFGGETANGRLILRATHGRHPIPLPPDLLPVALNISRFPNPTRQSVFLDADHFMERADPPITIADLEESIRGLKAPIAQAFKAAITDLAVKVWK
jgi:uncharacterized protein (TIGR04255 family)